jgi:alkylation response protein AidB-like acyl-CoA dehydrogenase
MSTPGVDVRPLRQMNGASHFNETFLSDVRIPDADRIGEVNAGWGIALSTLTGERSSLGNVGGGPPMADVMSVIRRLGRQDDPVVRQGLAFVYARQRVFELLVARAHEAAERGAPPGPEGSVLKLALSRLVAEIANFTIDVLGTAGTLAGPDAFDEGRWSRELNGHFSYRIGGGTDQIQRNTIGEKVLGLPGEPRVDKGVPFRSIPA